MRGNIMKKRLMSFALKMTPRVSLGCKLVPVQYREYEYCLLAQANPEVHKTRSGGGGLSQSVEKGELGLSTEWRLANICSNKRGDVWSGGHATWRIFLQSYHRNTIVITSFVVLNLFRPFIYNIYIPRARTLKISTQLFFTNYSVVRRIHCGQKHGPRLFIRCFIFYSLFQSSPAFKQKGGFSAPKGG